MYFRIVSNLTENLGNPDDTKRFMEMVALRQRMFREHKSTLLLLDSYDLICDHVLLYAEASNRLIGYIRSVPLSRCVRHEIAFPMENIVRPHPEYHAAYARFLAAAKEPVHMGYLCFDPAYKSELRGIKAIDLAVWIGLRVSGIPEERLAFAATINNRYKQDASMRLLGEWIPDLPDLDHPLIADRHRVILVPQIAKEYWRSQHEKFAAAYGALTDGARDLVGVDIKIAA